MANQPTVAAVPKISASSVITGSTKEGFLTKQGGSIKTWKKRYCVLKEDNLYYFKTQKDDDVTGQIPLADWSICIEEPNQKKEILLFCLKSQTYIYDFCRYSGSNEVLGWRN